MGFTETHRRGNFPGKSGGIFWVPEQSIQALLGLEITNFIYLWGMFVKSNTWHSVVLGRDVHWTGRAVCVCVFCLHPVSTNECFLKADPRGEFLFVFVGCAKIAKIPEKPHLRDVERRCFTHWRWNLEHAACSTVWHRGHGVFPGCHLWAPALLSVGWQQNNKLVMPHRGKWPL